MPLAFCGGLNANSPHRLIDLIKQFPGGVTVWEGLGGVALFEEMYHWDVGFEVSKA